MHKWVVWLLCLCMMMSVCQCQHRPDPAPEPELASVQQSHVTLQQSYTHLMKDNNKLGVFIAAAIGTMTLMAVVYCIYNQFYTKHPYAHTQQHDDSEVSLDLRARSSSVFPGCVGGVSGQMGGWMERGRVGYGSLSDTPSIISLPPSLSPPPLASPFPLFPLSKPAPLRTISAQDLEKSFL